jgi:filamentous hemagglutinin family protein
MLLRANARSRAALKSSASFGWLKMSGIGVVLAVPLFATSVFANPAGGTVATGAASISNTSANATQIRQSSEDVVIDWSSFNIGNSQSTTFVQPNAQAIAVNRIGSGNASQIMGTLDANGRVVLINGNGMLFGKGAVVNVGALIATSTDGADSDVLAGKFTTAGNQTASVSNRGTITASRGGLVALVAPHVTNSGTVQAKFGTVALGAANKFTVDFAGDGLVAFAAQGDVTGNARVANSGMLSGANVSLTARAAEGLATGVVSMTGTIVAQRATQQGGTIVLDGGDGGNVSVSHATLDASGALGGGTVQIGGWNENAVSVDKASVLDASATRSGNGGTVAVISSNTKFAGQALAHGGSQSGNGGTIETSGHSIDFVGAGINAGSAHGVDGTWLLDPDDLTIGAAAAKTIHIALKHDTDVLLRTTATGTNGPGTVDTSGVGNINIFSNIIWTTSASLTIDAYHSIDIASKIIVRGPGTLNLFYNDEGTSGTLQFPTDGQIEILQYGASLTPASLNIQGNAYTLVGNIATLAADIATNAAGDYALAANYNAALDGNYASSPIATTFTGKFEGLGNKISNLTIDNTLGTTAGLFAEIGNAGTVRDLVLRNANVSLTSDSGAVGALAADNYGTIDDVSVTGMVTGGFSENVGGLVGMNYFGGTIVDSGALDSVTSGYQSHTGGLAGEDVGTIARSYSNGDVTAGYLSSAGGLVGFEDGTVTLSDATGTLNAGYESNAGGLVGYADGTITTSYAQGAVTGGYDSRAGGLIGYNAGTITSDYAKGSVTAGYASYVGGLVGHNEGAITDAFARGSETATAASDVGGLVGYNNGTIADAYSTGGQADSGGTIGGLIGFDNSAPGSLTDTYWVKRTSGVTNGADGAGNETNDSGIMMLTVAQLSSGLPAGFDPSIWAENPDINGGLPYLLAIPPATLRP